VIIDWDGTNVPEELRQLPPGRYILGSVESIEDLGDLTEEEDAGIRLAMKQIEAGEGIPLEDVMREIQSRVRVR
jgi:predicted transcriptional regulator